MRKTHTLKYRDLLISIILIFASPFSQAAGHVKTIASLTADLADLNLLLSSAKPNENFFLKDLQQPIQLILKGRLQEFVTNGKADYGINGKSSTYVQTALLEVPTDNNATELKVTLGIRGQTSVFAMDFPKYKIDFVDKENSSIGKLSTLKVISHGWETDSADLIGEGLLASSLAAYREAAVYDLIKTLRLPIAQSRRAQISYNYEDTNRVYTGPAVLLETTGRLAKRMSGSEIAFDGITPAIQKKIINSPLTPIIALTETLIGNWDYSLPMEKNDQSEIHNISAIAISNGDVVVPVMQDFNMSGMVTGVPKVQPNMSNTFFPEKSLLFRTILWDVLNVKQEMSAVSFEFAVAYLNSRQQDLLSAVDGLNVDSAGREIIRNQINTFYEVLKPVFLKTKIL